ncbi:MAG: transglutaminaseTgpA domain-containing protein [Propionicimonas sp.]
MTGEDRLSVAGVAATFAAGVPLFTVTEDRSYLLLGLLLMACSAAIGALARRMGAREITTRIAQLLPVLLLPWLVPAVRDPWGLAARTIEYTQESFAPMAYSEGFAVFTAGLLWVTFLAVETLTIGLRVPAWTFPALVMPYAVCALAIYNETNPFLFAFPAVGYVLVLAISVRNEALSALPAEVIVRRWRTGVSRAAATAGGLALVFSVVLSVPIAERSANSANPGGSGAVMLGDPSLDLIRNVTSSSDERVISYTTTDAAGEYLRLAALPAFDDRGFHLTATDLIPLPLRSDVPGVTGAKTVRTSVKIDNLSSEYLPMPWVPTGADVADNWRYDPRTMAVVAIGDNRRTASRNLEYSVTSTRVPDVETWLPKRAEAGQPNDNDVTIDLPDDISPAIRQLADQVTAGARTAGEKAIALRDFLRSGAFTYSTTVTPGSTLQTLDDFLLGSRIGYCEQYAGGFAVMARMVGIPSRVVIGFLPGKKVDDHWEVTTRNMHAWTELYFGEDIGWVLLDATPGGAVGRPTSSASATVRPSSAAATPSVRPTTASPIAVPPVPTGQVGAVSSGTLPALAGVLAGLLLVAGGPLLTRRLLRWRRLAVRADHGRMVEDAWAEVRAVAVDHGVDWPRGSVRQVAAVLGSDLESSAAAELTGLAVVVERSRYSGEDVAPDGMAGNVGVVSRALAERWGAPTAWVRRWWPRSLWPQRPSS